MSDLDEVSHAAHRIDIKVVRTGMSNPESNTGDE